jgi:RimJ/RimL family protein N-acetyltransferase
VGIAGGQPPPYRIETERLVIRCWNPVDAPLVKEAVDASVEHLRPWMPWAAHEPQTLDEKVELLRSFRGRFDLGEDFVYALLAPDESQVLGGAGLHTRVGEGAFEIGYWIHVDAIGRGLATETAAALTRVAFALCGVDRVEIRVDPANERSAAIPRKLGFVEEGTLRRRQPPMAGEGLRRDVTVFTMLADEFPASPCAGAAIAAVHDAAGRPIALR